MNNVDRHLPALALVFVLAASQHAVAGMIFVSDSNGNVWFYHSVKQMGNQTPTKNVGKLVRDASIAGDDYKDDQDTVADLASGLIYRVTVDGDVIQYANVADYLSNTSPTQVGIDNLYSGTNRINGASYDPNLGAAGVGGFYSIGAGGAPANPNAGDIERYNNLNRFINNAAPNNVLTNANYAGALLNFYDPDPTPGMTVGNTNNPSHSIDAHYFQVAGNGRLEGFANLTEYNATADNRINITPTNAFAGTGRYIARAAFAVPVPEPASLVLCIGAAFGVMAIRRRGF